MAQPAAGGEEPKLEIIRLDLLDQFADYPIALDSVFHPGETVNVAFNLKGYQVSDDYRMKVSWEIDTNGPAGAPFAPGKQGTFDAEMAPEDDEWSPVVRYAALIPFHATTGVYKINVEAKDELSGSVAHGRLDVQVSGEYAEQSDVLTVRNFVFSLTSGGTPLREPIYRPGATIFASFDIAGYQLGESNAYELSSELELFDGEGSSLYKFNPVNDKGAPFYPRFSVPGSFQFHLDPTIEPGFYTLNVTVTDIIGQQSYVMQQQFEVR